MTKETRLSLMTKNTRGTPRHCILACSVLEEVKKELNRKECLPIDDWNWPYHILVECFSPQQFISLFCGGFRKTIDIQFIRNDGLADLRYKEVCFATPTGAANYIVRRLK